MVKANKSSKRYFFVAYSFGADGQIGSGNYSFSCNGFFNKAEVTEICKADVLDSFGYRFQKVDIVITNWIEMSKDDYEVLRG